MKQMQTLKHKHWQQKQKQESVQSNLKVYTHFYACHSLNHYVSLLLKCNFSLAEDFSLFGCVFASLIPAFW